MERPIHIFTQDVKQDTFSLPELFIPAFRSRCTGYLYYYKLVHVIMQF